MCSVVSIRSAYHYGQMSVRESDSNLVILLLAVLSKDPVMDASMSNSDWRRALRTYTKPTRIPDRCSSDVRTGAKELELPTVEGARHLRIIRQDEVMRERIFDTCNPNPACLKTCSSRRRICPAGDEQKKEQATRKMTRGICKIVEQAPG
jgi:hypothetical protein